MKTHDPETAAAAYLGGVMSPRARRRFEAHLVECPDCWQEVRTAGRGRGYAEAGRELAPQALRDRIRGEVALVHARRGYRLAIRVGVLALALGTAGGAFLLAAPDQPPAIEALVADFHGDRRLQGAAPAALLPERLGDLSLVGVATGHVESLSVEGHRYRDPAGHRVTVYLADRTFPMAEGARAGEGRTWRAQVGGVELLCSDRPFPALVVGDDAREVTLAARLLGMV